MLIDIVLGNNILDVMPKHKQKRKNKQMELHQAQSFAQQQQN